MIMIYSEKFLQRRFMKHKKQERILTDLFSESTLFGRVSLRALNDITLLGGKTGFTDKAGLCLATLASCGGEEYILITAGAAGES